MLSKPRQILASKHYLTFVFVLYIFAPELRRLIDFNTEYHTVSPITLLPIVSLLPALLLLRTEAPRLGRALSRGGGLWIIGFTYSAIIGALTVSPFSAIYALVQAAAPMLFAVLVSAANSEHEIEPLYDHIANVVLWCCFFASLYGIYQYASPPPWDVFWAQHAAIEDSQGETVAFGFRIFGPLNSAPPFAICMAFSILINLPRLRLQRWWMPILIAPQAIALMLTLVRACWIMLTIGLLFYLILSPNRGKTLVSIGVLVLGVLILSSVLLNSTNGAQGSSTNFITRLQTFTDLNNDVSVNTRVDITQALFRMAIAEPLGQGLGAIGLAAKLGAAGETIVVDNGYIARFIEMGFIGVSFFLASIIVSFVYGFKSYLHSLRSRNPGLVDRLAACVCIQVMFLVGQAGADVYFGSEGMFFWLAIYFASISLNRESYSLKKIDVTLQAAPRWRSSSTSLIISRQGA